MEEEITLAKNDTVRVIEAHIEHLVVWRADNPKCNQRETALVITKLEEAMHWAYYMVNREGKDEQSTE